MIAHNRLKAPTSIVLLYAAFSLTVSAAFAAPWCDLATDLGTNATFRGFAGDGENQFFHLNLPAAGILTVDLLAAAGRSSAWIDLYHEACGERPADVFLVERSGAHLVLAVLTAGELFLQTAVEAPRTKLVTSFVEAKVVEDTFDLEGSGIRATQTSFLGVRFAAKTEPQDVNPDTDGLWAERDSLLASFLTLQVSPQEAPPKAEPQDVNPDTDGSAADDTDALLRRLLIYEPICRRDELDDHGDTMGCATPLALGQRAVGEIQNGWDDDGDVFVLHLSAPSTVEVAATGDVAVELLDRSGQQLAAKAAAGSRILATLAPGRYFFRVTAGRGGGAYELTATA